MRDGRIEKIREIPRTTIRLSRSQKQLIRVAAAYFNLPYQIYLKRVVIAHAQQVVRNQSALGYEFKTITRKVTFIDEQEGRSSEVGEVA